MKHSSYASSRRARGFTLVELVVASAVTSLVLMAICGIYLSAIKEWERQQGQADSLVATSLACTRISDYLSIATGAQVVNRFGTGDALAVNMPLDSAYTNVYVPIWSGNTCQYRSGTWIIFYLSDSTGSYLTRGNILWAASMTWVNFPTNVVPDSSWSKYYNNSTGRITPISSLTFTMDSSGARPTVRISAVSTYKINTTTAQVAQVRTVCLRNGN